MEDIFKDTLQQSEIKLEILSEQNMIAALDVRQFEIWYLTSCYAACSQLSFATCRCLFQNTACRQYQVDCQLRYHARQFRNKKYSLEFTDLTTTVRRVSHYVSLDAVKEEVERTQKMLHQERNVKVGSSVSCVCYKFSVESTTIVQAVQEMKVLVSKQIEKRREKARKKEERLRKADEARAATAHDSEDDFPVSSSASALNATDQSLAQTRATAKTVVSSSSSSRSSSARGSRNAGIRNFFQPSPSQTSVASVGGKRGRAPAKRKAPMPAKRKTRRTKATGAVQFKAINLLY